MDCHVLDMEINDSLSRKILQLIIITTEYFTAKLKGNLNPQYLTCVRNYQIPKFWNRVQNRIEAIEVRDDCTFIKYNLKSVSSIQI